MKKKIISYVILLLLFTGDLSFADWKISGSIKSSRLYPATAPLPDGKILIAGGSVKNSLTGTYDKEKKTAEIYDPATGVSTSISNLNSNRPQSVATPLYNGTVLITGTFYDANKYDTLYEELFVYGPSPRFLKTGKMKYPRYNHSAVLLKNGKVFIVGGTLWESGGAYADPAKIAEIFDPGTRRFSALSQSENIWQLSAAVMLKDGRVLITGGYDTSKGNATDVAEIFDPEKMTFENAGYMNTKRFGHAATLLPTGEILITGGAYGSNGKYTYLNSAELYNPATGAFTVISNMAEARKGHKAELTADGMVLLLGGENSTGYLYNSEIFNPSDQTFKCQNNMNKKRYGGFSLVRTKQKVLVIGGKDPNNTDDPKEVETYLPGCR